MRSWIYPANPKYYDVISAFTSKNKTPWPMSSNVEVGDIIYIYAGNPFKQILFKCVVREIGLQEEEVRSYVEEYIRTQGKSTNKSFMMLKTIRNFEIDNSGPLCFGTLKMHGLKGSIMGPQCLENNMELFKHIKIIEE